MQLITADQAAEIMQVSRAQAIKLMRDWKVESFFMGVGRGKGWRYGLESLHRAIELRLKPVHALKAEHKKPKSKPSIFDMSPAERIRARRQNA